MFMWRTGPGGLLVPGAALGSTTYADAYLSGSAENMNVAGSGTGPWTYTFADKGISSADARRHVICITGTNGGTSGTTHTSLTANAGAVTFTKIGTVASGTNVLSIWEAAIASGTTMTAPILTVATGNPARAYMQVYVAGRGSTVNTPIQASNASANNLSGTIDVPASGLIIAAATTTTTNSTCTWTGVTENYDSQIISTYNFSGGMYQNTGGAESGRTIDANHLTDPSANIRLVACAWGANT